MDDNFKRRDNETDAEYQVRLTLAKLVDKVDLDWQEIVELLDSTSSADHIRKQGYGIKIYDEVAKKMIDEYEDRIKATKKKVERDIEDKRLKEINDKVLRLELEKVKLKDQRNNLNAIKREIARIEHLEEIMKDNIDKLNKSKPMIADEITYKIGECTGVCLISDIHLGVEVDNIISLYDPKICRQKMNFYIDNVIRYGEFNNIDELYVLGLGDYITGIIHSTNRYESRLDVCEQVAMVSELLVEAINKLSQHFICKVAIVSGNHDEIRIESKDKSRVQESFTNFIVSNVKLRLRDNVNVLFLHNEDNDNEHIRFTMRGFNFFASHGNRDKERTLDRTIEMFEDSIDYILVGHYHSASMKYKNNTCLVVNGCFSGENYSKNARLYAPAVQKLLIFDDNGIRCSYDINLNNYNKYL